MFQWLTIEIRTPHCVPKGLGPEDSHHMREITCGGCVLELGHMFFRPLVVHSRAVVSEHRYTFLALVTKSAGFGANSNRPLS